MYVLARLFLHGRRNSWQKRCSSGKVERAEEAVVLSTPASCMASGSRAPARRGFICHCFCVRRTPSISTARIAVWTRTGCIAGPMVKTGIMAIMLRQKQDSPWAIPTAQLDCIQCCSLEMTRVLSGTRRVRKVAGLTSELQASSRQQVLCEASVRLLHLELREEISAAV